MISGTRPVSWIKAALKEFEKFPEGARSICLAALTDRLKRLKEMFP
jgi:hypothetical protein